MMSLEAIEQMSRDAAAKAAAENMLPITVEREDLKASDEHLFQYLRRAPFIGDYVPAGFKKIESLFVDSSGYGADDEPALTFNQLLRKVRKLGPGKSYGITSAGQFQLYLGVYERAL